MIKISALLIQDLSVADGYSHEPVSVSHARVTVHWVLELLSSVLPLGAQFFWFVRESVCELFLLDFSE